MSRPRFLAIALCVLVAAAGAGWWGYGVHQKRELRKAIVALIADTGTRLRGALAATGEDARKLEEDVAAADRNLAGLKSMNATAQQELADAADDYLLTGREILKRVESVQRYRGLLSESLQALTGHMRADDHTGAWVQEAVKARERANKDYRDLSLAAGALDKLLQSFPASQKKIAQYVEPAALMEDGAIDAARARALEAAKQATAEIEKTRRLDAFR